MPREMIPAVQDINLERLKERGIKLIILDIDNTLVAPNEAKPHESVVDWLNQLQNEGFLVCIMTNNTAERAQQLEIDKGIHIVHLAHKPLKKNFREILKKFGVEASEACMVGDQLITDVLGANRMGIFSILVKRISDAHSFHRRKLQDFEDTLIKGRNN